LRRHAEFIWPAFADAFAEATPAPILFAMPAAMRSWQLIFAMFSTTPPMLMMRRAH